MMASRRVIDQHPVILPLFHWPELSEIERIQGQRVEIQRRISLLPPKSDRAVELRSRLKDITARQLALQNRVKPS